MSRVLFVCRHNAARSQIAAAFLEHLAGGRHTAASAGTHPADAVHPLVVSAMAEVGIDVRDRAPRPLTAELVAEADVVVRCLEPDPDDFAWPPEAKARFVDWRLPLPADENAPQMREIRELRDAIRERVRKLLEELV